MEGRVCHRIPLVSVECKPAVPDPNIHEGVSHGLHQTKNMVEKEPQLYKFLRAVLPEEVPFDESGTRMQSRDEFIQDVFEGIKTATMSVRMT